MGRVAAVGAVVAQFSQALGSFVLNLLALRLLGLEGLGRFAQMYGIVVVATGLITGLVGDSLTVLDRSDPRIRAGLQVWLLIATATVALAPALVAWAMNIMPIGQAALFGAALAAFVIEDTIRRLLMACLRFWSLVIVDATAVVMSIGLVLVVDAVRDEVSIDTFLAGLLIGQVVACVVGVLRLPTTERWISRHAGADSANVWRYGSWRAAQQMLRPTMLAVVRGIVTVSAGLAVYGQLEAARVYVSPAMLVATGVVSYLFASYARDRTSSLAAQRRRADVTVGRLSLVTATMCVVAPLSVPYLGGLLSTSEYELNSFAVFGWAVFIASVATVTPYGVLAAVRGRQARVLALRTAESIVAVGAVAALVVAGVSVFAVPLVLAAASFVSGFAIRFLLLEDDADESGRTPLIEQQNT